MAAPPGAIILSNWLSKSELEIFIENKIDRNILVEIKSKNLLGDGVAHQAYFQVLTLVGLVQKFGIGLTRNEFDELNNKYKNTGFTLIDSQSIQTMSIIVYQGVWHKRKF